MMGGTGQENMFLEEKLEMLHISNWPAEMCLWWHQLADGRKGGPLSPVQMLKW